MPNKFLIFFLILALIGLVIAVSKESYRRYQIDKEAADLKKEIASLEEKNESLIELLDYFNSEKFLEKEARLKLNLLKEGEKLVIIAPDKQIDSGNQVEDIEESKASNFKKWLEYLGLDAIF